MFLFVCFFEHDIEVAFYMEQGMTQRKVEDEAASSVSTSDHSEQEVFENSFQLVTLGLGIWVR